MTENNNQDPSSKKWFTTCENNTLAPWSDLDHDILLLVMMKLGVFDFHAFSGVCKSWRPLALSNKNTFMASIPPMTISIPDDPTNEDYPCCIEDTDGRIINSILPNSGGRACIGFTYGHLILYGKETRDFWLLDPVTKHGVHFPDIPSSVNDNPARIRAFLVFSPSISGWVFVMTNGSTDIWFSISGQGVWNHVSSTDGIVDIHVFKGKMYAIDEGSRFCELTLDPEAKLTVVETKNFPNYPKRQQFYSWGESLYVTRYLVEGYHEIHKLDFEEMKWVLCKRPKKSAGSSNSKVKKPGAAVKHGKGKVFVWKHMVYPMID
ncbi:hypothetical protein LXL04_003200 [Taraxacum kok-saghyz]